MGLPIWSFWWPQMIVVQSLNRWWDKHVGNERVQILILNGTHDRETAGMSASDFVCAICDALNRKHCDDPCLTLNHPVSCARTDSISSLYMWMPGCFILKNPHIYNCDIHFAVWIGVYAHLANQSFGPDLHELMHCKSVYQCGILQFKVRVGIAMKFLRSH